MEQNLEYLKNNANVFVDVIVFSTKITTCCSLLFTLVSTCLPNIKKKQKLQFFFCSTIISSIISRYVKRRR